MARPLAREDSAINDWIVLLVLVVAAVVVLAVYFTVTAPAAIVAPAHANAGDQIEVDYIGYFQSTSLVFDTSNRSVAMDNVTWPKAFSFAWRTSWSTLTFTIGDGSLVTGFDLGVRGMSPGETKTIVVPADEGYGPANPALLYVHNLTETLPVRATMNQTAFAAYYKQPASSGTNVTDPVFGWSVMVAVQGGLVTITNSPYPGEAIRPYNAWDATILSVDDTADNGTGLITIQHHLDPSQVDKLGGTAPAGQIFYLSDVNLSLGKYTMDFNHQVVGRTLVFQVTLVRIISGF